MQPGPCAGLKLITAHAAKIAKAKEESERITQSKTDSKKLSINLIHTKNVWYFSSNYLEHFQTADNNRRIYSTISLGSTDVASIDTLIIPFVCIIHQPR